MISAVVAPGVADMGVHHARLAPEQAILGGRLSTEVVADDFPDAAVVKAFNQLPANVLERQLPSEHGKKVVFVASNDAPASAAVARLAADIVSRPWNSAASTRVDG